MTERKNLRFPNFDSLQFFAERFKELDLSATEAFIATIRTALQFVSEMETYFATRDLSQARFMVMMMLMRKESERVTVGDLAKELNVTGATITGIVNTLVSQGWVDRDRAPEDRRTVIIALTDSGKKKLRAMLPAHYKMIADIMAPFSETDRQSLKELMKKFGSCLEEMHSKI